MFQSSPRRRWLLRLVGRRKGERVAGIDAGACDAAILQRILSRRGVQNDLLTQAFRLLFVDPKARRAPKTLDFTQALDFN